MTSLTDSQKAAFDAFLEREYVHHLPALIRSTPLEQARAKNIARSISAFFLAKHCNLTGYTASQCVYDDFDDFGIDAIYFDSRSDESTLYLIQSKNKNGAMIEQGEILVFKQGVEKILNQDYSGFNDNFIKRQSDIENAVLDADRIVLVLVHCGLGLNHHAKLAMNQLISTLGVYESLITAEWIDFGPDQILQEIKNLHSSPKVDAFIAFDKYEHIAEPRDTYIGVIPLSDLIALHNEHGRFLYERNIRTFLGIKTGVNASIRATLEDAPELFLYLTGC